MSDAHAALLRRATELGVEVRYRDVEQRWHDADPRSLTAVVEILAADATGSPVVDPVCVLPSRRESAASSSSTSIIATSLVTDAELELSDGTVVEVTITGSAVEIPDDLPIGCHLLRLDTAAGAGVSTVVRPPHSMVTDAPWIGGAGIFVPAYALWDDDHRLPSFRLLGRLARAVGALGTQLVTTLPLYATFLDEPFEPSPYSPASRLHWNEAFLDDHTLPPSPVPPVTRYLDWAGVAARRRSQLVEAVDDLDHGTQAGLERFVTERPDVAAFARFMTDRGRHEVGGRTQVTRSHELAQYLADRQLSELAQGGGAGLAIDLPIGCHPDGYERWAHPELFAPDCSIGAPPDRFFTDGQDWGLPPQLPAAGRRSGHRLWRDLLGRAGEHAALLRIDHVMAVHRLWWVPAGFGPHEGVYVTYPREELLAVIAATATEVETTVVGEDLGTVPDEVVDALERWEMLGMYEEQFHTADPTLPTIPARSVAGLRTHDMQAFAAFVADQGPSLTGYRRRLATALGREVGDAAGDLLDAILERLARSASAMVTVDLDDLLGETEPHNVPGRVLDTNWRRRLDRTLTETIADPAVQHRLQLLADRPARR